MCFLLELLKFAQILLLLLSKSFYSRLQLGFLLEIVRLDHVGLLESYLVLLDRRVLSGGFEYRKHF